MALAIYGALRRRQAGADDHRPTGHRWALPPICSGKCASSTSTMCTLLAASVSGKSGGGPDPCAVFRRHRYAVIDPTAVPALEDFGNVGKIDAHHSSYFICTCLRSCRRGGVFLPRA